MTDLILKYLVPQKLIDFALKVKEFLKGKKTYIAAAVLLLQALLGYTEQIITIETAAGFTAWLKGLSINASTTHLAEALGLFGIRAAIGRK